MVKKSGHHGHHHCDSSTSVIFLNTSNPRSDSYCNDMLQRENNRLRQENLALERQQREEQARFAALAIVQSHQNLLPASPLGRVFIIPDQLRKLTALPANAVMPVIPGTTETLLSWAIRREDLALFRLAVNDKGYRLNQQNYGHDNPLFLIAQSQNSIALLDAVKTKVTKADADFLINLILSRNTNGIQVNQDFEILNWLLQQNLVGKKHSQALNQLVTQYYLSDSVLANAIFSHPTLGEFYTVEPSLRQKIAGYYSQHCGFNSEQLLKWYSDSRGTFYAQKLLDDTVKIGRDLALAQQTISFAASKKAPFEALEPGALAWLLVPSVAGEDGLIWSHLIKQPKLLSAVPSENKQQLFNVIKMVYEQTQHSPEKELVALARTAFEQAPSAEAVVDFAFKLEFDWKHDNRFSAKSIEVMLKLAKINVLSRLKAQSDAPSEKLESFLGKHRTTYHFLCLPFHLTLFSTTSTKTYNLRKNASEFNQAVDKDVAAGQAEYQAFMR